MHPPIVVRDIFGREEMIPVLSIREIVRGQVCPGKQDLVIESVELHVLQTPSLVDSLRNVAFSEAGQVRRVIHAYFDAVGTKLLNQRS